MANELEQIAIFIERARNNLNLALAESAKMADSKGSIMLHTKLLEALGATSVAQDYRQWCLK